MTDSLTDLLGQTTDRNGIDFHTVRSKIAAQLEGLRIPTAEHEQASVATTTPTSQAPSVSSPQRGRLGPQTVQLSRTANLGPLMLSDGDVEVEAHCHLGSILATVCVFEGKWQYEATIEAPGTSGIQQIGWAPYSCAFTNEEGVGDSRDSYAFDGNRVAKWHDGSFPYGQAWVTGDVIGCCIDLDNGDVTYYRNGHNMGVAFTKVRKGIGYFPAISLSYGERCYFNFGRRPFEYPVESYLPLQSQPHVPFFSSTTPTVSLYINPSKPPNANVKCTSAYLTDSLRTLLRIEKRRPQSPNGTSFSQEDITIAASIFLEYLAPSLLDEYYVVDIWYPFLVSCMEEGLVEIVMRWLQLLSEQFEWESCMRYLFKYLAFKCRTTGLLQALQPITNKTNNPTESTKSFPALALVLELLQIPSVLDFALSLDEFNTHLEHFIAFKQPSKTDLATLLPFVWWQGGEGEPQCSESSFLHDMGLMNACIRGYEDLVFEIFVILHRVDILLLLCPMLFPLTLTRTPGLVSASHPISPSSVDFFRNWINYIIVKNKGANRNVVPPGLSPASVLVNLYFALLRMLFVGNTAVSVSSTLTEAFYSLFCKSTEPISEFARLGGTLGHLQKNVPYGQLAGWKESTPLEVVMIDAAVMVYHLGVASRFKASSQQQNTARQLLARLSEAKKVSSANGTPELVASVVDELRLMNYSHAILVGDKQAQLSINSTSAERRQLLKQETMYKITVFLADLLTTLSQQGTAFVYTPEYYMESMVDGFHSLRRTVPPLPLTSPLLPYSNGLTVILCAFIRFFNDPHIVNPDVRDLLLQSIGVLMQYNEYVTFIENLSGTMEEHGNEGRHQGGERQEATVQTMLVRGLLQAFDKKFWVTVTSILLRLWKGIGIRQNIATDPPSTVFRKIFKDIVSQDTQLLNTFLNNLFNTLNTTTTEFSVMKLDVTKMSPNDIRKANFLMELSINLLKILEVVSVDVPEAFIQSELNMTRLVELLLLILMRTTTGPEAARLDIVLVQDSQVSRAWILAPLVGIILHLDSHSTSGSLALIDALLADASFKMEAFNFLVEFSWQQVSSASTWIKGLEEFVGKLKAQEAKKATELSAGNGVTRSSSIELCSICYSAPIDTQFEPCKHASCHRCISRHLLNNTRCFFCNADVVSTHPIDQK